MVNLTSFDTTNILPADSLHGVGTFFQKQPIVIHPQLLHTAAGDDWIFYILFGLLLLMAFIRYFYPMATKAVFSWFKVSGSRKNEENHSKQGLLVPSFLLVNFIVSITLLDVAIQMRTGIRLEEIISSTRFWLIATGGVTGFYLYNLLSAFLIGFIFDTGGQASLQIKNITLWAYVSGLFLTPFLLIYYYSGSGFVFDIMVGGLMILLLFKWFQTVKTGLFIRNFNVLHLFLYLCTVEIIPLFLLVKVYVI